VPDPAVTSSPPEELFASVLLGGEGADPYPAYHRLREAAPLLRLQGGVLVLTRYDDCDAALRHRSLGKAREPLGARMMSGARDENTRRALAWMRRTMLFTNPPDHTRLRTLVSSAFTVRHVDELHAAISERAVRLLDGMAGQPGADFMSEVALPLPVNVIADLLGVPDADREGFIPLVHDVTALLEPLIAREALERAVSAQARLRDYFGGLLAEKRRAPSADLLSRLASSRADDKLDDEEMIAAAILLFGAGFETTTNLLGNGLRALLENPAQLALLRDRPGAIGPAVEEMLRYDSPIQLDGRTTLEPVAFAGTDLPAGELVVMLLGAANRDPGRFTDPDRFDVTRDEGPHLAFASGIHFCLGAHLARLEAKVVFSQLMARFPVIELAGEPEPRGGLNPRGLARLPVTLA
jgi:cytochrome P450